MTDEEKVRYCIEALNKATEETIGQKFEKVDDIKAAIVIVIRKNSSGCGIIGAISKVKLLDAIFSALVGMGVISREAGKAMLIFALTEGQGE